MAFGEALANLLRHAFDLEIASMQIANAVAKTTQGFGEFVVIDVLDKFPRLQHLVVLQRLPAVLLRIRRRIEDNAMRVEVRVERVGSVVCEQRGHEILSHTQAIRTVSPDARGGELLELDQRHVQCLVMRVNNPFVLRNQGQD